MPDSGSSSLASLAAALHLAEGLGAAKEGRGANNANRRQDLEEVPAAIVEEEDALHGHDRAEEDGVGDGRAAESLGDVADIGTKDKPLIVSVTHTALNGRAEYSPPRGEPAQWRGRPARTPERRSWVGS